MTGRGKSPKLPLGDRVEAGPPRSWLSRPAMMAAAIVVLFVLLGVLYSLVTPVLEASDEFKHYPYVQHVQTHRELPVLEPEVCEASPDDCAWLQDGGQPPAYYAIMAAATSWIDTSDLPSLLWKNKHAFIGNPTQVCNKNLIIHRPEREAFPWRGSVLAVRVIRLLTLAFGASTVLVTYSLSRTLFPERPTLALGAAALTAFNPMFLFVSASVNNDAMAALVGSFTLLVIVRVAKGGESGRFGRLGLCSALLGLLIGVGALTKLSLLGLIPVAGLVVAIRAWETRSHERPSHRLLRILGYGVIMALVAAAVSGWWFVRNWRLYGDPTALNVFIAVQGTRAQPPNLHDWLGEFGTFRWTYWGLFGGVNVMAPRAVYWLFDLLSLLGLAGFLIWVGRRWQRGFKAPDRAVMIPALWGLILFVSVLRWTWISPAFQGRLVFPGIAGISSLMALGFRQWAPEPVRPTVGTAIGALLLIIAGLLPFVAIAPAYARPESLELSDVPESARVEPKELEDVARVVGVEYEPQSLDADNPRAFVDAVVYWEAMTSTPTDYVSFARLLGRGHELAGHINRHPACGMVPTSLWHPGEVWRDPYRIPVAPDAQAPSRLRLEVGLYDPKAKATLGAIPVGYAKLAPPDTQLRAEHRLDVKLADGVTLLGYDLSPATARAGEPLTVTLHWEARQAPSRDYQVFVHLLGQEDRPIAQGDGPPVTGDYPTSLWEAGETVVDLHRVTPPSDASAGPHRILVGMYHLETMERLPRADGGTAVEIPLSVSADQGLDED